MIRKLGLSFSKYRAEGAARHPVAFLETVKERGLMPRIMNLRVENPLLCYCCSDSMKAADTIFRRVRIELFLRFHGLWVGVIDLRLRPTRPSTSEPWSRSMSHSNEARTVGAMSGRRRNSRSVMGRFFDDPFPEDVCPIYEANLRRTKPNLPSKPSP